ncbi:MarR family winged helix-turn-helix transcriptional regulator [Streptomyces olivaceus]|uniref:MarR family winged helix-turn-helix transcriptional regulator n=1 Tax=Streptomyces olivaceus TaxID=47716 RepID=UPI0036B09B32
MVNSLGDQWLTYVRVGARLNQALERALSERHNLCVSAYDIMEVMWDEQDWIRSGELTARSSRSQPQVSRLLTQMVNADYVARKPSPGDGRGFQVRLTPAGLALFREATATVEGTLRAAADEDAAARELLTPSLPAVG